MSHIRVLIIIIICALIENSMNAQTITSASSGNWSDGSTWIGGIIPTSANNVVIANGHTVTVNSHPTSCKNFSISGTSQNTVLQIADGVQLNALSATSVINAPTSDNISNILAVNNGSLLTSVGISFQATAGNTRKCIMRINNGYYMTAHGQSITMMTATGFASRHRIEFTGSGRVSIRGAITGGTIIPSGSSTVVYEQNSAQTIANHTYDNLSIGGSFGTGLKTLNSSITVRGNLLISNSASLAIAGTNTLTCGGNWSVTSTAPDPFRHNTSTVIFNGTGSQSITTTQTGGETFHNLIISKPSNTLDIYSDVITNNDLTISGANEVKLNANLTIVKNFNIAGTSSLTANTNLITIGGNWNVTSTSVDPFIEGVGAGTVSFNGSNEQTITNNAGETFNNLTINKSSGQVTLNSTVNTNSLVTLSNGIIMSSTTNLFVFNAGSSATGTSNSSYISGPVRKIGNTAFTFPTGKNNFYAPISISAPSNITHHFTAEYFNLNPDALYDVSLKDLSIHHLSTCEYWILDRTNGASSVNVTLSWDSRSCGVDLLSDLKVARWDGTQWRDHGNGVTTGDLNSGTVRTGGVVSSFSPFTLASSTFNNILPLDLISFDVKKQHQSALINWVTQSESGVSFFELEKSENAVDWVTIYTKKAIGTSDVKNNYSFTDEIPYANSISYYRLKTTDDKGASVFSDIKSVSFAENASYTIYPNPNNGITLYISCNHINSNYQIEIIDMQGKTISFNMVQNLENLLEINLPENLPKGIYNVKILDNQMVITKRLIVN
jgi:hypothetical protein